MTRAFPPLHILFCLFALTLAAPPPASAQDGPTRWQALGGPGGRVTHLALAPDGETVFAVTVAEVNRNPDETQARDGGFPARADALYKSDDRGQSWFPLTNDLPPAAVSFLFVDQDDVVWGVLEPHADAARRGHLWMSPDLGQVWRSVPLARSDLRLRAMAQTVPGDLWLLANATGDAADDLLYRRGPGESWISQPLDLPAQVRGRASGLAAHPIDARLFLTTESGDLLLSTDRGRNWTLKSASLDPEIDGAAHLAFPPDQSQVILLVRPAPTGLALERSEDRGDTWSPVRARGLPTAPAFPTALVAAGQDVLLLNTDRGVYRSADAGRTWQALEGALDSSYVYHILPLPDAPGALLAGAAYGLYQSQDRGSLWRQSGTGLPNNSAVLGLLTHPDRPQQIFAFIQAVGTTDASLMLLSRDGGATWLPAGPAGAWTKATAWAIDPRSPDHLYLAGKDYVATSKDGGVTWQRRPVTAARRTAIAIAPSNPDRIYVDGTPGLVSNDGGETWEALPSATVDGEVEMARGVAVDPNDPNHVWFGHHDGVRESRDGGKTMQRSGLDEPAARWLTVVAEAGDGNAFQLFAGLQDGGIMRWRSDSEEWQSARAGLPPSNNILVFAVDPSAPGLLWATRDGGGIYASADGGASWQNTGRSAGDNLGLALAPNYQPEGGWFLGTANAGVWLLGPERPSAGGTPTPPGPTSAPSDGSARSGVDARIEVVWPHNFAPLSQATLANVGLRLFLPASLEPPLCGWRPSVELWRAVNTEPAALVAAAEQRTVDGQPFPYWDVNDVDITPGRDESAKIYFFVKVDGVDTATSVWAHAADARTYFPEQLVPSGVATGEVTEVDARIQIVWPHDGSGAGRAAQDATLANVAVTLFKHGTRLSVPLSWRPPGGLVRLYGAWNAEVSRPLEISPAVSTRQSGVITYPVWEFNDVPVERARDGISRLYLWTLVDGVHTYPTIWAHGADARTFFPVKDEPIQGCLP